MTIPHHPSLQLAFIQGWEWIILLVVGLLIFGRRLPEIGRSIGRTIVEFKKGMNEVTPDMNAPVQGSGPGAPHPGHMQQHSAPGTLPPSQPQQGMHGGQPGAAMPQQGTDPYAKGNYPNA